MSISVQDNIDKKDYDNNNIINSPALHHSCGFEFPHILQCFGHFPVFAKLVLSTTIRSERNSL
jgi:hypothetical protein